jgi:hypothetical protein
MNGTHIAGYFYRGQVYGPECIGKLFMERRYVAGLDYQDAEAVLDHAARRFGINRHDQRSYSSRQFPHPLYLSDVSEADRCTICGRPLLGEGEADD